MLDHRDQDRLASNRRHLERFLARFGWLIRLRPQVLANPLIKLVSPHDHRRLIDCDGLRLYIDPMSDLGRSIIRHRSYEPDVVKIFKENVRPGDVVFDIGANEGYFAALAASLVGREGLVVAVEPQSRLYDILSINLTLNAVGRTSVYAAAVDAESGNSLNLSLTPLSNTGASSIVRQYRWSRATELVQTVSMEDIFKREELSSIDFIKIDVEGFEYEVINSLESLLKRKCVRKMLVDYHASILRERAIPISDIHERILARGFRQIDGAGPNLAETHGGYVLYELAT